MIIKKLFTASPDRSTEEQIETLLQAGNLRVERILSHGQSSPVGFWYDQPQPEWVALLKGAAILAFMDEPAVELGAGDHLLIPAHVKHRVEHTSEDAIWLAIHFRQEPNPSSK